MKDFQTWAENMNESLSGLALAQGQQAKMWLQRHDWPELHEKLIEMMRQGILAGHEVEFLSKCVDVVRQ